VKALLVDPLLADATEVLRVARAAAAAKATPTLVQII
jgi:hypothetical protein